MKQLAQYQDGRLELQEVSEPLPPPGGIVVRLTHSVISPGTEKMKVEQARMNLLQKAKARPDQVRKVLDTARTLGWKAAMGKVLNRLESPSPLGYSAAGVVEAVDAGNTRFRVGDAVACGGAECAFHAELVAVPDLLAAPVPHGVALWQAAYTTLLSISMHAVRQADIRLGERVLVIGQGLVGQLCTAMVRASGARALAVDVDPSRLQVSTLMGAERVANPADSDVVALVREWTDGHGVDAVLLCIGGKATAPVEQAVASLRDRGVLVIVGMHDAALDWKTCFAKEIQVRYSRSYGPGRYDPQYEWGGRDYPIDHVRWTENRNFEACLQLLASGQINLEPLTTRRASFGDAVGVYDQLMESGNKDIGVVLEYARGTGVPPVSSGSGVSPENTSATSPLPSKTALVGSRKKDRVFVPFSPHRHTEMTKRNLPHWQQEDATYFLTFRQADAIPQSVLSEWGRELDAWMAAHPKPWDDQTQDLFHELFLDRKESWLDRGEGSCILAQPDAAGIIEGAMRHFDGSRYVLDSYVVMPNHVHVLVKLMKGHDLSDVMHSWKSFTSREIKKLKGLGEGAFWQDETFEHAVRSMASLAAKRLYIAENPVKARLTAGYMVGRGIGLLFEDEAAGAGKQIPDTGGTPVPPGDSLTLDVIGAGNFARTMLLPHLKGQIPFGRVINQTGLSARHVKEKFGFAHAETGGASGTGVPPVSSPSPADHSALLISTRHHLHTPLVLEGLAADRHIFVEKPLCLTAEELHAITDAVQTTRGSVMVGFNRRFAPATVELKRVLSAVSGPKTLACHVFAGPMSPDHWYANLEESGGRVIGEACHFFDLACHIIEAKPVRITAQTVWPLRGKSAHPDSITAQVDFDDGSSFQLIYTAEGDFAFPKETFRIFASGLVAECENFQKLSVFQNRKNTVKKFSSKGHAEEMAAWLAFLKQGHPHPLPFSQSRQSMELTFAALESIRENRAITLP